MLLNNHNAQYQDERFRAGEGCFGSAMMRTDSDSHHYKVWQTEHQHKYAIRTATVRVQEKNTVPATLRNRLYWEEREHLVRVASFVLVTYISGRS